MPRVFENSSESLQNPTKAIIFSNERFDGFPEIQLDNNLHVGKLEIILPNFNVDVQVFREKTANEIKEIVKSLHRADLSNYSSLMLIIVSNGVNKGRVYAKDTLYDLEDDIFTPIIDNRTLANKPKIFIIDANRGSKDFNNITHDAARFSRRPNQIIKLFSTYDGYKSYRTPQGHSLLLDRLCVNLENSGNSCNLKELFTNVQKEVIDISGENAYPIINSSLTLNYYLGQQ
uniref:Caspase family p20 domain-containing protein n=1 Tax=Megaselia scalaris TaxID=36166 RepID=T1GXB4_MEGSC